MQDQAYSNDNNNNPKLLSSLQSLGLTNYESKAYLALLSLGICDARRLCAQSGVPSSKIYTIMEKFELLGLVEVQQSKPAKFKALEPSLAVDRLLKNREREILSIKDTLPLLESELDTIFSKQSDKGGSNDEPFFNLQFGMKNHIQNHLPYLADARVETLSYFETTCLLGAKVYGHSVKREIINNIQHNNMSSKVIFGTEDKKLVEGFLKGLPDSANIELKITKQIHAPFHVIDKKSAIVVVDNPLIHEGRIASIHAIGRSLAKELHEGYRSLWDSAKGL